jgi:hypothetical protein
VPWSGDIHTGEHVNIAFPALSFDAGNDIVIRLVSLNGSTDAYEYQNEWTIDLPHHLSKKDVILMEFKLDPWAYEIYWQLANSSGDVLYAGGNTKVGQDGGGMKTATSGDPGAYVLGELVEVELELPETQDCYSFLLVDSYGNGLYAGAYLTFSEKKTGKEIYSKAYNYTIPFTEEEVLIEVDPTTVSVQPISSLDELLVYPNPVDGALHLRFEATQDVPVPISLMNSVGETILTLPEVFFHSGLVNYTIDLPNLSAGVYALQVASGNSVYARMVVVIE